jgi:hypothetical protein
MSYRYPAARIHEIVKADKALVEGQFVDPKKRGSKGLGFEADVELLDGPFTDLIFRGKAGDRSDPETYDSNLFLDQERIRGIGFNPVGTKNLRKKLRIPEGWHENLVNPNLPTNHPAYNVHEALPDFEPTEFADFTRKAAERWNIDLHWEGGLL